MFSFHATPEFTSKPSFFAAQYALTSSKRKCELSDFSETVTGIACSDIPAWTVCGIFCRNCFRTITGLMESDETSNSLTLFSDWIWKGEPPEGSISIKKGNILLGDISQMSHLIILLQIIYNYSLNDFYRYGKYVEDESYI